MEVIKQIKDISSVGNLTNPVKVLLKQIFGKGASLKGIQPEQCSMSIDPSSTVGEVSLETSPAIEKHSTEVKRSFGSRTGDLSHIPGPRGLPFIGTLLEYTLKNSRFSLNHLFLSQIERSKEYGPIYHEKIGPNSSVYITDARLYQKVVRVEGPTPFRKQLDPMVYYRKQRKMALGMTNAQGEEWRQNRLILGKKMQKPKEVEHYITWMSGVADDLLKRISSNTSVDNTVPEIDKEICKWSLESLCTFIYEDRIGCLDTPPKPEARIFVDSVVGYFRTMHPLIFGAPLYKLYPTPLWRENVAYADKIIQMGQYFVEKFVSEHKEKTNTSLMAYLMDQPGLQTDDINLTIIDMMMGSIETTTNTMLWLLYVLSKNPDKQDTLYQEIERLSSTNGEEVVMTPALLSQMEYLKACLKETFRLYPIAYATSRIMDKEVEIAGYTIPAQTHIQGCLYAMGRDVTIFDNPEKYIPERWLRCSRDGNGKIGNCTEYNQYEKVGNGCPLGNVDKNQIQNATKGGTKGKEESSASGSTLLAPFIANLAWGHGARQCPGRRLAEQEIYITLFKILKKFRLRYYDGEVLPMMKPIIVPDRPMKIAFEVRDKKTGGGQTVERIANEK